MKEVKGRNQKLCKILGQGECELLQFPVMLLLTAPEICLIFCSIVSTKTQLLEQIEELTAVKNELTAEVCRHTESIKALQK